MLFLCICIPISILSRQPALTEDTKYRIVQTLFKIYFLIMSNYICIIYSIFYIYIYIFPIFSISLFGNCEMVSFVNVSRSDCLSQYVGSVADA